MFIFLCCCCYSGDYQTHFKLGSSDEEDDSDKETKKKKSTPGKKSKRTKECPGCGCLHAVAVKKCDSCDYQFTSKSMLLSTQSAAEESQSIRERFPFEPEREEDGTLIIQAILGRRPRKMGHRWIKTSSSLSSMESRFEYEFLIKFKSLSYLHVQWLNASQIEAMNRKSRQALNRYLTKLDLGESVPEDGEIDLRFVDCPDIIIIKSCFLQFFECLE